MNQLSQATFTCKNGDTWLFEYDSTTDTATIQGSDTAPDVYKVIEGIAYDLILDKAERQWLLSAWEEAAGRQSALKHLADI